MGRRHDLRSRYSGANKEALSPIPPEQRPHGEDSAALHWAAVVDAGARAEGGPDPYEPLLLFFERGGSFTTESGFIEVYGGSVRRRTWPEYVDREPADISPAALAALDETDS